jgi:hemolysin III
MVEALARPLLRGVSHQIAFFATLAAGTVLVALADSRRALAAAVVYSLALAGMFGGSALYHRVNWRSHARRMWARRLDRSTIFLCIAGTYTPFALLAFHGTLAVVVLAIAWGGAALGLLLNLTWIGAPRWLAAIAYLGLGWVAVSTIPQLLGGAGIAAFTLVAVGGGLYTAGALCYVFRRPDPFPRVFGYHEVFHLLVVVAAVVQYVAVSLLVI